MSSQYYNNPVVSSLKTYPQNNENLYEYLFYSGKSAPENNVFSFHFLSSLALEPYILLY